MAARLVVHVVVETWKFPVVEITMLSTVAFKLLLRVNVFGELVVPTVCRAKVTLLGVSETGKTPLPESATVCGLLLALSFTLNPPVLVPITVGVNATLIVQWLLGGRLVVQVVVDTAKSPVVEIAMLFRATVWLFVRVNVLGALIVPTACVE